MSTKLYVGNLPFNTGEADIEALFAQAGQVAGCNLILDRMTSKSRGFAFVEMASQEAAEKAIEMFNKYELEGRSLIVNEARPREPRGGTGGDYNKSGGNYGGSNFGGSGGGKRDSGSKDGGKRKPGKGSRRGARQAKRDRKSAW